MKIAVLGLGKMGPAISERLLQGGHHLTVWNRSKGRADQLLEIGATEADTPDAAVTSAEVVITSLANNDAVREIALREGGIRSAVGDRTYVDCSTISPGAERRTRCTPSPASSRSPSSAPRRPSALVTPSTWRVVTLRQSTGIRPVLATLSERVKYYPRPEMASSAKLASNLLLLSGIATLAEAFTVARAGGLGDEELTDLFAESPLVAPGVKNRFRSILEGSGPTWWTTELGAKDARGWPPSPSPPRAPPRLWIGPVLRDLYQAAADAGLRDDDVAFVARIYR